MGATVSKTDFTRVGTDEPHASRRKAMLKAHPEIVSLYGPDIRLLYAVVVLVALQLFLSVTLSRASTPSWVYWLTAWAVGGTITHALSLANHELSHNLCFHTPVLNELLGMVANLAQGLPSCVTFKKYHLEHHYYQGVDGVDSDIPTAWEGRVFNSAPLKVLWALGQPLAYALRPVLAYPKPVRAMEVLNFVTTLSFDAMLVYYFGWGPVLFNVASTLLGMGLHPVAGHFIAEHYLFHEGEQETYSYYGVLNYVCFNVGYHNEHHDHPKVSGFNLPAVRALAPEFYEDLHAHESWVRVIYDYITRPDVGPFSRLKRAPKNKTL